jgi:hypothetical protein
MKKFVTVFLSLLFITFQSAKAEMGMGITGALHMFDVSGTETTRQSGQINTGSHNENVFVPEIFVESILENGGALGIAFIPTRKIDSSRSDTSTTGDGQDTGTYKAEANFENVFQLYGDIPITNVRGNSVYAKVGVQHATLKTMESLNSGSTYPDENLFGYTLGLGAKADLPFGNNMYYKADLTYTAFEDYEADSSSSTPNKVEAELEDIAVKLSLGYKF